MHREFLMGNEAMALGALAAGVDVVAGSQSGTPATCTWSGPLTRRPRSR